MSRTIRLKNPNPLPNQKDEDVAKYGRAYWSLSSDLDLPVKFNIQDGIELHDGSSITYEEWVNKESAKGTEYMQLKKVRPLGSEPRQVSLSTADHKPTYRDNSDGMRQGMCFNNAAHYVSDHTSTINTPEAWAETVWQYANALYLMGDLGKELSGEDKARATAATLSRSSNKDKGAVGYEDQREDVVITDIGDEPINLDDIPF